MIYYKHISLKKVNFVDLIEKYVKICNDRIILLFNHDIYYITLLSCIYQTIDWIN